jgi:hypothetical protein
VGTFSLSCVRALVATSWVSVIDGFGLHSPARGSRDACVVAGCQCGAVCYTCAHEWNRLCIPCDDVEAMGAHRSFPVMCLVSLLYPLFSKRYTQEEAIYRAGIYAIRAARIDAHNARFAAGEVSFTQGPIVKCCGSMRQAMIPLRTAVLSLACRHEPFLGPHTRGVSCSLHDACVSHRCSARASPQVGRRRRSRRRFNDGAPPPLTLGRGGSSCQRELGRHWRRYSCP